GLSGACPTASNLWLRDSAGHAIRSRSSSTYSSSSNPNFNKSNKSPPSGKKVYRQLRCDCWLFFWPGQRPLPRSKADFRQCCGDVSSLPIAKIGGGRPKSALGQEQRSTDRRSTTASRSELPN